MIENPMVIGEYYEEDEPYYFTIGDESDNWNDVVGDYDELWEELEGYMEDGEPLVCTVEVYTVEATFDGVCKGEHLTTIEVNASNLSELNEQVYN